MVRPNATSPGLGTVVSIENKNRAGRINTHSSQTSGSSATDGAPGNKVRFAVI